MSRYDKCYSGKTYNYQRSGIRKQYKDKKSLNLNKIVNIDNNIDNNNIFIINENEEENMYIPICNLKNKPKNDKKRKLNSELKMNLKFNTPTKKDLDLGQIKKKLLKSHIGFFNAGGSCYMASIIQILIHLEKFVKEFFKFTCYNAKPLSNLFYKFLVEIAESKVMAIEIQKFAKEYNQINYKFNGKEGNNPMTFFNEFIKKLGEENNGNIVNLFTGKKNIIFIGMSDCDYEEEFIFHLIYLDENNISIKKALYQEKAFEDDENIKLKEEIIVKPEIFVINLEIEEIEYNFEEEINVYGTNYQLKAINRYTNFHSIS